MVLFKDHFGLSDDYTTMSPVLFPRGFTRDFLDGKVNEEELGQKIAESEKEIEKAIDGAMENVRAVALEVAAIALDKLIGKAPSKKDLAKAIDQAEEEHR